MKPRHWMALSLGAVVLYPLMYGPVMAHRRAMEGGVTQPTVPAFYQPLERMAKASPMLRGMLLAYLDVWGFRARDTRAGVHRRYLHEVTPERGKF